MALSPGTRLGPYVISASIGAGGMGEVYRARDTRLKRDVALKILPQSFATDPDRLARFQREAEVLASLNHSNIAAIHGLEETDGVKALVMELVNGETLADRIARGPIPVDEALPIAKQIAEALEAAHEAGIIHRDLKPANVKVRDDGTVKVLDFGLAKALEPAGAAPNASQSPTITTPAMTQAGVIMGTAAYMSPEQARGKPVDKRVDIWAFGCVLYEMFTGVRAFPGDDLAETLGAVIHKEPEWSALPLNTPAALRAVLQRCLYKDPKQRVRDAGDVRLAVDGAFEPQTGRPQGGTAHAGMAVGRPWKLAGPIGLLIGAGLGGLTVWLLTRPVPPPVVRLTVSHPGPELMGAGVAGGTGGGAGTDVVMTPDGARIVYFTSHAGQRQINVRALDRLTASQIGEAGDLRGLFLSPDGQWVGFADAGTLKKINISGGPAITICKLPASDFTALTAPSFNSASWGTDDTIIFAYQTPAGLWRVDAAGGNPEKLTTPDREKGENWHRHPEVLPGGEALLFDSVPVSGIEDAQIVVLNLRTGERKVLVEGGTHARYAASGHLVYTVAGILHAVAFDLSRLEVVGSPVPVPYVENIITRGQATASFSLAPNGTLAYIQTESRQGPKRMLVWVDRQGREEALMVPPRNYASLRLSPDGTRVALDVREEQNDIWVWDLSRSTLTRLTFDPGINRVPVWTPDGRRLAFSTARDGAEYMYWQAADGSGTPELLTKTSARPLVPSVFSPDGSQLIVRRSGPPRDIELMALDGERQIKSPMQTPFDEVFPDISPDGRWLVYGSNESGRGEVYVRPFPDLSAGRWQVSTGGGTRPLWARNGRELFYLTAQGSVMAVPVQLGSAFAAGPPQVVVKEGYLVAGDERTYDVSPDGGRFLMFKDATPAGETAAPRQLVVVLNWTEELKRLVPVN